MQWPILDLSKINSLYHILYQGLGADTSDFQSVKDSPLMPNDQTKGEAETAIRNAIIKFEQEFMGRGPTDVKAFIHRDIVLVRLKGVLTPAERQLAKNSEGVDMVKRMRQNLIAQGREKLCSQIAVITGTEVTGLFTDIETHISERIIVFTLEQDLDTCFR